MSPELSRKILVIDNDPDILTLVEMIFRREGYDMLTVQNGVQGLEIIAKGVKPDLILLDIKMPVMDGWDFARKFRENFKNCNTPIALLTAVSEKEVKENLKVYQNANLGIVAEIYKPFDLQQLIDKVNSIIH